MFGIGLRGYDPAIRTQPSFSPYRTSELAGKLRCVVYLEFLDVLTSNPDVWSKTAFFLCYDENDGFFDHVVPPTVSRLACAGFINGRYDQRVLHGKFGIPRGTDRPWHARANDRDLSVEQGRLCEL